MRRLSLQKRFHLGSLLLLVAFTVLGPSGHAQSDPIGSPFFTLFEPSMVGARHGINDLGTDRFGRILLTSGPLLIAFDGNAWTTYSRQVPEDNDDSFALYCTALLPDGRLYASSSQGIHELYLEGNERYRLRDISGIEDLTFQGVHALRKAIVHQGQIYFYGQGSIARVNPENDTITFIQKSLSTIASLAIHDNRLYTFGVDGEAFYQRNDSTWQRIKSNDTAKFQEGIRVAESWEGVGLLLGPDISSIKKLDTRDGILPWKSEIDNLETHRVIDFEPISPDYIAVSVANTGVFILDRQGKIIQVLDRSIDYRFGQAHDLIHLENGIIWAIAGESLVRIDFLHPLSDVSILVPYAVTFPRLFWHNDVLHVTTDEKLIKAETHGGQAIRGFTRLGANIPSQIINAVSVPEGILCAALESIYLIRDDGTVEHVADNRETTFIAYHPDFPNQAVAVGGQTYQLLLRESGSWHGSENIQPSPGFSYEGKPDKNGYFWLEQGVSQIARITLSDGDFSIDSFDEQDGLGPYWINIWVFGDDLRFSVGPDREYLLWDEPTKSFKRSLNKAYRGIFQKYPGVARPALDQQGNLWIPTNSKHTVHRIQPDDTYREDFATLSSIQNEVLLQVFPRENGQIWFAGEQGIYLYDPAFEFEETPLPPPALIRIESIVTHENLLESDLTNSPPEEIEIPYRDNSLLLKVTTPTVSSSHRVQHQYQLTGKTSDWTAFSTENSLILNNLYEGNYSLRIRSISPQEGGPETTVHFTILPPFYRSGLAYAAYIALGALVFVLPIHFLRNRAERRNEELQRLVRLRTREIGEANRELERLVKRAESATNAKTTFLHNVSHEMRTPLNSIIGPAALLQRLVKEDDALTFANLIRTSAERLNKIIEELLVFTENESYNPSENLSNFHLKEILDDLYQEFKDAAKEKRIELQTGISPKTPRYWKGDPTRIRQTIRILLENAIKFTRSGSILLTAGRGFHDNRQTLVIEVADTGIGMKRDLMDSLFEPFQQGGDELTGKHDGTGIGLAICHQLVLSMEGSIEVESEPGVGSVFRIFLPIESRLGGEAVASNASA